MRRFLCPSAVGSSVTKAGPGHGLQKVPGSQLQSVTSSDKSSLLWVFTSMSLPPVNAWPSVGATEGAVYFQSELQRGCLTSSPRREKR